MISRMYPKGRRGFACSTMARVGLGECPAAGYLCLCVKGLAPVARRILGRGALVTEFCAAIGANRVDFPFILPAKAVKLGLIITQLRGFAVCVKRPFFLSQLPPLRWLAASRTKIRLLITLPSAPLVVQRPVRLSPMQPAAAKPKGRLLARLLVVCRAALQACLLATNTATGTAARTGLTAPRQRRVAILSRPFGDIPRMAFFHFGADGAHPRKGCYV